MQSEQPPSRPRVSVVGGGFAGRRAERILRAAGSLDVTLVDANGVFEYVPAALRCCVRPHHAQGSVIPQLPGTVVARVTGVELGTPRRKGDPPPVAALLLSDGSRLRTDWVLFASGSGYAAPIKAEPGEVGGAAARRASYRAVTTRLEAAHSVVVVGGGTVGVEMAAEVAARYGPRKHVTLVASSPRLLERMPPKAGRLAAEWLQAAGVTVVLGERVASWGGADAAGWGQPGAWKLRTSAGRELTAGAVFNCAGGKPHTQFLAAVAGCCDARGALVVDANLKVCALANAYAAGDCAAHGAEANAMLADLTASVAAANLLAEARAGKRRGGAEGAAPRLRPFPRAACGADRVPDIAAVSLGPYNGVMQFSQLVVRGPPVAAMKAAIEALQVGTAAGYTLPRVIWNGLEATNVWLATKLFQKAHAS